MSKGRPEPADILSLMAEKANSLPQPERRAFLMRGLALAGATAAGPVLAAIDAAESLPPSVPPWTRSLGRGVVTVPYGVPSEFEASVIRRTVPWLTANNISSISFTPLPELKGIITPNGLVFERYHGGVPDIDPGTHELLDSRSRRSAVDVLAGGIAAFPGDEPDLLSRVFRQQLSRMARTRRRRRATNTRPDIVFAVERRVAENRAQRGRTARRLRSGSWPKARTVRR